MTLTGDPRRWANEPGLVGVVRYPDTHRWGEAEPRPVAESLQGLEDVIRYEGPHTIAAVFLETIVGTNGILIPPDGYLEGVREMCDRYGILMVADEVMAGFGRTGRWFAVDHWGVTPDLMTMAKGLTSSYLPLGAVAMRHHIAEAFETKMFYGGLTYSAHPGEPGRGPRHDPGLRGGHLVEHAARMGPVMRAHHERLAAKHPSVGAHRSIGLFGILDLVRSRDPWTPLTPFNGTSDEMKAIGKYLREHGVYAMVPNNSIHTNPPLCITEAQLAEGFDVIDARPRHRRPGSHRLASGAAGRQEAVASIVTRTGGSWLLPSVSTISGGTRKPVAGCPRAGPRLESASSDPALSSSGRSRTGGRRRRRGPGMM